MMVADVSIPSSSMLFAPVRDAYGSRLALVFGNEFYRGECPFYTARQCHHCDIGAGEGTQFTPEMNRKKLEFFRQHYGETLENIVHLVVYNSGSTLNKAEMSRETLGRILGYAALLKNCKIVALDSREMYITRDALDYVIERLREDQKPRIILGIESQSDEVRIRNLNKLMTKEKINRSFQIVASYDGRIGVDVNIVFQPPELIGEAAITEAIETLRYGLDLGEKYNVSVDFNFHPYYPSTRSKIMYPNHPRANLGDSKRALLEMKREIEKRGSNSKIFIGWQDEEHDQEQEKRREELEAGMSAFDRFNVYQDFAYLHQSFQKTHD